MNRLLLLVLLYRLSFGVVICNPIFNVPTDDVTFAHSIIAYLLVVSVDVCLLCILCIHYSYDESAPAYVAAIGGHCTDMPFGCNAN